MLTGPVYVVRDDIDTDQIIPAQYLTLVPTIPEEYTKLGSYAMVGLPDDRYPTRFVPAGEMRSPFPIMIAGRNFGCGSSREHAPIALGAAGTRAVVAETYARIFFRNAVATGELFPFESNGLRLCEEFQTGEEATLDFDGETLTRTRDGRVFALSSLGEVRPVVEAGGIFNYARQTGMIAAR